MLLSNKHSWLSFDLNWTRQRADLLRAKPLVFMVLRYCFLFWSVKLNRTEPVKNLNEVSCCTRLLKNNLSYPPNCACKMPPCCVCISLTKVRQWRPHAESLCCGCATIQKGNGWIMMKCLSYCKTFRVVLTAPTSYVLLPKLLMTCKKAPLSETEENRKTKYVARHCGAALRNTSTQLHMDQNI